MREFAEDEIVIPTGRYAGLRFKCSRQPWSRLWFDAVDSGRWQRFACLGPTQSGKTLTTFVIPVLYHLFEVRETAVVGLPSMDMAADKWSEDLLPVIQASKYREYLPRGGSGSRGGRSNLLAIKFSHGPMLRFMSGGGDDKSRSGFNARVAAMTEVDGMDKAGEASRESDKVSQIEARTQSYDDRARVYMECTASVEAGRIWQEYTKGTESRIAIRCTHCRRYVSPEREHLTGWQSADNEISAGETALFVCPECGAAWNEDERTAANHDCILVHKGQEITPEGTLTGRPPKTNTLGFRWSAVNNLLVRTQTLAREEWKSSRAGDEDNAEKRMLQFWWAKPFKSSTVSLTELDALTITKRLNGSPRGRVPANAGQITIGIDVGRYLCHWVAIAWGEAATPNCIEYGRIEVPTNELGEERALFAALRGFRDGALTTGWPADDGQRKPTAVFIDAGYLQDVIIQFCEESPNFFATKGFGTRQISKSRVVGETTELGWKIVGAPSGAGYEILRHPQRRAFMVDVDVDFWKTWLHARLQSPMNKSGAFMLHDGAEHLGFAKHLVSEKKIEEFVAGKGLVIRWEVVNRNNHYLDAATLACTAGHAVGQRLFGQQEQPKQTEQSDKRIVASDFMTKGANRW